MKRLKQLIVITLVAVMAFSLAACDSSCSSSKLSELLVNSQNAKTEFYVGEEYSSEGLVVTAVYGDETATLTSSDYVIDSSAYDSTTAGTYKIGVSYTEGKNEVSNSYNVKVIVAPITSLTVNTSGATIEYLVGDALDLSGITATAVFADENEETLSYSDLTVDTSAIDMYTAGDYKVTVSYTRGGATKSDEFVVSVLSHSTITASLSVTKTTVDYNVSSATGVSVDISDIAVYFVDEDGVSETALESGKYELKCFKGDTEIEIPSTGSLTLTEGKYQIWAYMEYTLPDLTNADEEEYTYTLKDFVFINVYDEVSSIALSNASTGTFTQEAGTDDLMSSTWEYTLTYASGYTETIYGTDANLDVVGIITNTTTTGSTATVTYTKVYADGSTKNVSCDVTYAITGSSQSVLVSLDFTDTTSFSAGNLISDTATEAVSVNYADGSATGFYITKCSSTDKYNLIGTQNNVQCLQMQGTGSTSQNSLRYYLAAGTYTITVSYFNSNADRYPVVLDADGNSLYTTAATSDELTTTDKSIKTRVMEITLSDAGYIYIGSASKGLYFTAVEISVVPTELVSLDFTNTTSFSAGNLISDTATEAVSVNYADGSATGFYITKCSSTDKYNLIGTQNSVQCLQMQGTGSTSQNSLRYYLAAGTYSITVSYFNSNADRYPVVLDADGNSLYTTAATSDELTTTDKSIKTRVMEITLSDAGYIYIGSASKGLYFTAISITAC